MMSARARRGWVVLGALVLLPLHDASAESLRVVTFNLFHGGPASGLAGDGERLPERLEMTIAELRRLGPDVIALQEASISPARGNVAERIARALGYHVVHAPATERLFRDWFLSRLAVTLINFNEGPAVLSRWPIVARQTIDLPRCLRFLKPRVLLRTEIDGPHGRLQVYSTHTSGYDCELQRIEEVARDRRAALPSLVMGDLNAREQFPALARFTTRAGFVDAFRAANPTRAGFTDFQRPGAAAPTVSRRVDYVFVVPGARGPGAVLASRVVLNEPHRHRDGTTVWPSDHYGVLAEIDLEPR